jgi:hypothetical protein
MASSKVAYLEHTAVNASSSMARQRPAAQSFRDLVVWQKAHQFVLAVYRFTAGFPQPETYGLSLQMRRAAVSIARISPRVLPSGARRKKHASSMWPKDR